MRTRTGLLVAALLLGASAPRLAAQAAATLAAQAAATPAAQAAATPAAQAAGDVVLSGVVLDADGRPAPGVPVALHRITQAGGSLVENAVSDEDGRFALRMAADADEDAVYFVAARYREELFIGPTFRAPFPAAADYVIQVGIEEASASALLRGGDVIVGPPPSPWRWALLGVIAAAFAAVLLLLLRRAWGPAPRRRLLMRIARLDEAHAQLVDEDARADFRSQREQLFERLRTAE